MGFSKEIHKIFEKEGEIAKQLGEDLHINASGNLKANLARQHTLFEVEHGRSPRLSEKLLMKEVLDYAGRSACFDFHHEKDKNIAECIEHRMLNDLCRKSLERGSLAIRREEEMQNQLGKEMKAMEQQQEREIQKQMEIQQQKELSRGMSL